MADGSLDRDTWFDLGGGIIPIGVTLFFFCLFFVFDPFGENVLATGLSLLLLAVPIVTLAIVLYVPGRIISEAERTGESKTATAIMEFIAGKPPTDDADE